MQLELCAHVEDIACWKGGNFFWKTLDMKDLSDSYKTSSEFLQTFPRQFPNLSRKDLGNHLSCEAAATATRMQLDPLEKDTWSLRWSAQGEDTQTNRWCSYPHFLAMKINRDNVPVFVAGGQKIPEHLQFRVPKTTWGADPVPIGYVSIQGSISSLLRISIYPLVN